MSKSLPNSEHPILTEYDLAAGIRAFSTERMTTAGNTDPGPSPYDAFNITHYCGDTPQHVLHCREMLCRTLGIADEKLILPRQTHGTKVLRVDKAFLGKSIADRQAALEGVDAIYTTETDTCIGVSTADCVPILLCDTRSGVIAAIHAGWRGVRANIIGATFQQLREIPDFQAGNVCAAVGPSISKEAFEVGDEVYEAFAQAQFPMPQIAERLNGKWHIDLWAAVCLQLLQEDVALDKIKISGICTWQSTTRFFSARRLGLHSGRIFNGILRKSTPDGTA